MVLDVNKHVFLVPRVKYSYTILGYFSMVIIHEFGTRQLQHYYYYHCYTVKMANFCENRPVNVDPFQSSTFFSASSSSAKNVE